VHGQAPRFLTEHITPAVEVASRHRLRSSNRHRLIVPCCRLKHVRPSGFSCRWSDSLELTAIWTQRSGVWYWQFHTFLQNNSVQSVVSTSVTSALEINLMEILILLTRLLTYHHYDSIIRLCGFKSASRSSWCRLIFNARLKKIKNVQKIKQVIRAKLTWRVIVAVLPLWQSVYAYSNKILMHLERVLKFENVIRRLSRSISSHFGRNSL